DGDAGARARLVGDGVQREQGLADPPGAACRHLVKRRRRAFPHDRPFLGDESRELGPVALYPGAPAGAGVGNRKVPIRHFRGRPAGALGRGYSEPVGLRPVEDHISEREEIRDPFQQLVAELAPGDVVPQRPYGRVRARRGKGASLRVHCHIPHHSGSSSYDRLPMPRGSPGSTDTHRTRPRTTPSAARRHAHSGKYERPSPEPGVRDAQIAPKRVQVGGGGASSSSIGAVIARAHSSRSYVTSPKSTASATAQPEASAAAGASNAAATARPASEPTRTAVMTPTMPATVRNACSTYPLRSPWTAKRYRCSGRMLRRYGASSGALSK